MPKYIPSLGVSKFTELDDAPKSYSGQARKVPVVKSTEDGLDFKYLDFNSYETFWFIAGGGGSYATYNTVWTIGADGKPVKEKVPIVLKTISASEL
jgi:hypothetical protein